MSRTLLGHGWVWDGFGVAQEDADSVDWCVGRTCRIQTSALPPTGRFCTVMPKFTQNCRTVLFEDRRGWSQATCLKAKSVRKNCFPSKENGKYRRIKWHKRRRRDGSSYLSAAVAGCHPSRTPGGSDWLQVSPVVGDAGRGVPSRTVVGSLAAFSQLMPG